MLKSWLFLLRAVEFRLESSPVVVAVTPRWWGVANSALTPASTTQGATSGALSGIVVDDKNDGLGEVDLLIIETNERTRTSSAGARESAAGGPLATIHPSRAHRTSGAMTASVPAFGKSSPTVARIRPMGAVRGKAPSAATPHRDSWRGSQRRRPQTGRPRRRRSFSVWPSWSGAVAAT